MGVIKIKEPDEIELMREAGRITALALDAMRRAVKPGVSTDELNQIGERTIRANGAEPIFLGYRGYRHATCVSVNEEVVHGIPGVKVLTAGDIVSLDVGARKQGYCGDCAATFPVGRISGQAEKLLRAGKEALKIGLRQARAGNHLGDVSHAIQAASESRGYSVVRDLYGHGIGREMHEDPLIPNYGPAGEGPELKPGMVLAIEPMLNIGTWRIRTLPDGWTVVTEDGALSCHFEHTIVITTGDPEILTWLKTKT
jgi:methionyl aminopeptidase